MGRHIFEEDEAITEFEFVGEHLMAVLFENSGQVKVFNLRTCWGRENNC